MAQAPFEVGNSVRVKEGAEDSDDMDWKMEGAQGRIVEISRADPLTVLVAWDSITLKSMPASIIKRCEEEGLDWTQYHLLPDDIERAAPRDTEEEVRRTRDELQDRNAWVGIGEQGRHIQHVLSDVSPDDQQGVLRAWEQHLAEELTLPFEAVVAEPQERGPLRRGDCVRVEGFEMLDSLHGLIARLRHERRTFHLPVADLEASDEGAPYYEPLHAYRIWFANR